MQKLSAIVIALCLMTAAGVAQVPTAGNVFFGYSYNRGDTGISGRGNLNGWEGSFEGRMIPHIGMVADFSEHYGTLLLPTPFGDFNASTHVVSYLFGPRVSVTVGKFRPFAHVLIGAAHLNQSASGGFVTYSETDFGDAIGGGVDYRLVSPLSLRVQADDLQTRFNGGRQDDARISTGIALHF